MGMYTEIRTNLMVTDPEVIKALTWMVLKPYGTEPDFEVPDHEFFKCERWKILLTGGSAYFDDYQRDFVRISDEPEVFHLRTISNIKNYSQEIRKFAEWIRPYCTPQDYPIITEEYEEFPELTRYYQDGRVERDKPQEDPYRHG